VAVVASGSSGSSGQWYSSSDSNIRVNKPVSVLLFSSPPTSLHEWINSEALTLTNSNEIETNQFHVPREKAPAA